MPGQARHDGRNVSLNGIKYRVCRTGLEVQIFPIVAIIRETEKGRRSDPSMSLVLFTDPGLFLNVPKAKKFTPRVAPSQNHPFHCLHQRPKSH